MTTQRKVIREGQTEQRKGTKNEIMDSLLSKRQINVSNFTETKIQIRVTQQRRVMTQAENWYCITHKLV